MASASNTGPASALVAKAALLNGKQDRYLVLTDAGELLWVADPEAATPFASMREATRMAMRLPADARAFGMPRQVEISAHRMH